MKIFSIDTIHRLALERATSVVVSHHPELAQRFRSTLKLLTREIVSHRNQRAAWNYSSLNGNGSPVEFTFSSMSPGELRYTVEVAGPDARPEDRLALTAELLSTLGAQEPFQDIIEGFQRLQYQEPLTWGAWLGVRHYAEGDQYKIYMEAPSSAPAWVEPEIKRYLRARPTLPDNREIKLVAMGQTPGSSRREFYFRIAGTGLTEDDLSHLLSQLDMQDRRDDLLRLMRDASVLPEEGLVLPNVDYGLSYSALPDMRAPIFSVFAFTNDYIGGDMLTRHSVARIARSRGWKLGAYFALTKDQARDLAPCRHHNVIAFLVGPAPHLGLHISLSPPRPT